MGLKLQHVGGLVWSGLQSRTEWRLGCDWDAIEIGSTAQPLPATVSCDHLHKAHLRELVDAVCDCGHNPPDRETRALSFSLLVRTPCAGRPHICLCWTSARRHPAQGPVCCRSVRQVARALSPLQLWRQVPLRPADLSKHAAPRVAFVHTAPLWSARDWLRAVPTRKSCRRRQPTRIHARALRDGGRVLRLANTVCAELSLNDPKRV